MFERSHYAKLAEFWKDEFSKPSYDDTDHGRESLEYAYLNMVNMLMKDNRNFNRDRFDEASGWAARRA